ncbi:hypothetical protein H5410_057877 [Solanum commersonii]|uniref:Uncharacterized protein n=1 Tax=Solanum commersonii TaxID=4109 RepID=A0A9J5WR96_SOLCO|nr:hypothetical protein H5410_057877 [Solanum commersonii]
MVGALSVVGSPMVDSHSSPCLCLDALPTCNLGIGDSLGRKQKQLSRLGIMELSTSFVDLRFSAKCVDGNYKNLKKQTKGRKNLRIVNDLGGQYEESFSDIKTQILNYFTYKAVRTILNQLNEMNPPQYHWFNDLTASEEAHWQGEVCLRTQMMTLKRTLTKLLKKAVVTASTDVIRLRLFALFPDYLLFNSYVAANKPRDGKHFIRNLAKEKQELAEKVMATRLSLYAKWIKKCDHKEIYNRISDQNVEVMRERLMETVIWPSDDTNTGMK